MAILPGPALTGGFGVETGLGVPLLGVLFFFNVAKPPVPLIAASKSFRPGGAGGRAISGCASPAGGAGTGRLAEIAGVGRGPENPGGGGGGGGGGSDAPDGKPGGGGGGGGAGNDVPDKNPGGGGGGGGGAGGGIAPTEGPSSEVGGGGGGGGIGGAGEAAEENRSICGECDA